MILLHQSTISIHNYTSVGKIDKESFANIVRQHGRKLEELHF